MIVSSESSIALCLSVTIIPHPNEDKISVNLFLEFSEMLELSVGLKSLMNNYEFVMDGVGLR